MHLVLLYMWQIEFYFGDSNLQKDRFLQQKMKEHPDGCMLPSNTQHMYFTCTVHLVTTLCTYITCVCVCVCVCGINDACHVCVYIRIVSG